MRVIALMLCCALAGCSGMISAPEEAAPASAPATAETPAAPPPSATAAPQRRATQALRGTSAPPTPPPQAQSLSGEEQVLAIRQGCWAAADRNRALKGLEARADWVTKCITDKSKEPAQ